MTIEEKLKKHILTNYKSIREFVQTAGLPYSTVDGILKRGIANSSIGNVLKICKALEISADELANGNIVPAIKEEPRHFILSDLAKTLEFVKTHQEEFEDLTIDGQTLSPFELETILNSLNLSISIIRDHRKEER